MTDFVDFDSDLSDDDISFASVAFPEWHVNSVNKTNTDFKEVDSVTRPDDEPTAAAHTLTQPQWVKIRVPPKIPPCAENTFDFTYRQPIVQNCERTSSSSSFSSDHKCEFDEKSTHKHSVLTSLNTKDCQKKSNGGQPLKVKHIEKSKADTKSPVPLSRNCLEKVKNPRSFPSNQLRPVESVNWNMEAKVDPPDPNKKENQSAFPGVNCQELRIVESENLREEKTSKVGGKTESAGKNTRVINLDTVPINPETEEKKRVPRKRKRSESTLSFKRDFSYSRSYSRGTSSRTVHTKTTDSDKWNKDLYEVRGDSRDRSLTRSTRSSRSRSRSRSSRSWSRSITRSSSRWRLSKPTDGINPKFLSEDLKPEDLDLSKYDEEGRKVFVGNINMETTEDDISEVFGKYGSINKCYIPVNRKIGFVVYRDVESALGAVRCCNLREVKLRGRIIRVLLAKARGVPRPVRGPHVGRNRFRSLSQGRYRTRTRSYTHSHSKSDKDHDLDGKKIFVGRLPQSVRVQELQELFEPFGEICQCYTVKRGGGNEIRRSIGVGFVIYKKAEDAQKAVKAKNQTELHGRYIQVKIAKRPSINSDRNSGNARYEKQGRKLHVGKLPLDMMDRDLKAMFAEFGDIEECYIPVSHITECPLGYGFVTFKDARDAIAAKRHWDGKLLRGSRITCQKAKPPDKGRPGFRGRRRN